MAEDFRKLLDQELALRARRAGRSKPDVSPVALVMLDVLTEAFCRHTQHVTDCQQTAIKAYAKAVEVERRLKPKCQEDGS